MIDAKTIADRYIAVWNERDPAARRARLAREWTGDARYADPLAAVAGVDEIDALIAGVHQRFPDFTFRLVGSPDGYGDKVRFSWGLGHEAAGEMPIEGTDFAVLSNDRIAAVTGFLDKVPAAA